MSDKRLHAAKLLSEGFTHKIVAQQVGVCERTIDRWAVAADVKEVQQKAKQAAIRVVEESAELKYRRIIEQSVGLGLNTVVTILRNPDSHNRDKLKCVELLSKWYGLDSPTKHLIQVGIEKELDSTLAMLQGKMSGEAFNELITALTSQAC